MAPKKQPAKQPATQPSQAPAAVDTENLFSGLATPENLLMLAEHIKETENAVRDIPACLELIARCTLMRAFVVAQKLPSGEIHIDCDRTQFEQVWAYLTPEEPSEDE